MRRFVLARDVDITGVSGTGVIVWGIEWPDLTVSYRWNTHTSTTCIASSIADVKTIHGHDGATRVVWLDNDHEARRWVEVPLHGRPAT